METIITGTLIAKAVVKEVSGGKKVTNFTIVINDGYKKKDGEKVETSTFFDCDYWFNPAVAEFLNKGTIVQLTGRLEAKAWLNRDGVAKATLLLHTKNIKLLGYSGKGGTERVSDNASEKAVAYADGKQGEDDDLPF